MEKYLKYKQKYITSKSGGSSFFTTSSVKKSESPEWLKRLQSGRNPIYPLIGDKEYISTFSTLICIDENSAEKSDEQSDEQSINSKKIYFYEIFVDIESQRNVKYISATQIYEEVEVVEGRAHGWVDLVAFDPRTGTLLVIEVKTMRVGTDGASIGSSPRPSDSSSPRLSSLDSS